MSDRVLRNLCDDINHASAQLKRWREDGHADRIAFWRERLDELIDQLPRNTAHLEESAT